MPGEGRGTAHYDSNFVLVELGVGRLRVGQLGRAAGPKKLDCTSRVFILRSTATLGFGGLFGGPSEGSLLR